MDGVVGRGIYIDCMGGNVHVSATTTSNRALSLKNLQPESSDKAFKVPESRVTTNRLKTPQCASCSVMPRFILTVLLKTVILLKCRIFGALIIRIGFL